MSLVTRVFIILTAIAGFAFLIVVGKLMAKQENFKTRFAAERFGRVQDELVQERLANRYASLKERTRKAIIKRREHILIQNAVNIRAEEKKSAAVDSATSVKEEVDRFSEIRQTLAPVVRDFSNLLRNVMDQASEFAIKTNEVEEKKARLWKNVAMLEAKNGHYRENINVLDYNLYRINLNNREKRAEIESYRELDPMLYTPGIGGATSGYGEIISYDEAQQVAVINIGFNENVQKHQVFTITRDGQYIAQLEVIQVFQERSACRINPISIKQGIRVGDSVKPRAVYSSSR